jgi:hypothetical protein
VSSGSGSQNTVTSSQQVPLFEQQASQNNQALAQSIGSQPYPVYQGPLIQGMDPLQTQGQQMAVNSAGAAQPDLNAATAVTGQALTQTGANSNTVASYMNPFVQQSLAPQIQDLQLQLAQQQQGINTNATQANAFGDARQGAAQSLQNLYGNQALNQLVGTGYDNAYNTALSALQAQQGTDISAGSQLANIGQAQQSTGLTGANAVYAAGQQNQAQGQSELNAAYQQYLNQINWPVQMLNVQESALSNSPYNIATAVTLPSSNSLAQGFGGLSSLAGLLGATGSNSAPFGGQAIATGSKS